MNACMTIAAFSAEERNKILVALAILMGMVIVGGVAILLFRRRLHVPDDTDTSSNVGFSLSDLRTMRDQGEITSEEYEATRAKVIAKVKSSLAPRGLKNPANPGFGGGDSPGEKTPPV